MLCLEATRSYGIWKPGRELAPYGPWQEHEPRANNYKDRVPGVVHLGDANKLEADYKGGVSLYASGFYTLPMALGHCWKQILRRMGLGSRNGHSGARSIELASPLCLSAALQGSV